MHEGTSTCCSTSAGTATAEHYAVAALRVLVIAVAGAIVAYLVALSAVRRQKKASERAMADACAPPGPSTRGSVRARELRAGEAALRERPLLFVVCGGRRHTVCAVCGEQGRVRWACAGGCGAHYCSRACLEADGHGTHSARLCRRLGRAPSACKAAGVTHPDGADAVRWALHALWLRESSPDRWHALRRLEPRDEDPLPERAHEVLAVHTEVAPLRG